MTDKEIEAWASSLKVGDEVLLNGAMESIQKVVGLTPKWVKVGGYSFRKNDGRRVGDTWSFARIEPATDEARARIDERIRRVRATNELQRLASQLRNIPVERIEAAVEALNESKRNEETAVPQVATV